MNRELINKSICSTCNELDNCFTSQPKSEAVIFCNEFDDYTHIPQRFFHSDESAVVYDEKAGLCVNCDNNVTCINTNEQTKKLYCEEHHVN